MTKPYLIKLGESFEILPNSIQSSESVLSDPAIDERFKRFAAGLKRIAPKANDFLYFSAIMLHAAEAALVNSDGTPKLDKYGKNITAEWDKKNGSWKWVCSDPYLKCYKNSNGDIFPEEELVKAYKNWVGKPLCIDHKSSSVDAIRGVILDTYYDRSLKRVIGLCALDRVSYPDLARKVSTGYSTSVSMGTAVGKAICTDCGTVASTERDFCNHMKTKTGYGEINVDLQPIELSIVVSGADPQAKIRTIIAAARTLVANTDQEDKLKDLEQELQDVQSKIDDIRASSNSDQDEQSVNQLEETPPYGMSSGQINQPESEPNTQSFALNDPTSRVASNNEAFMQGLKDLKSSLNERLCSMETSLNNLTRNEENSMANQKEGSLNKEAFYQGAGGVNEPTPGKPKYPKDPLNEQLREKGDKHMNGEPPFPEVGDVDGLHPSPSSVQESNELERKKLLLRAESEQRTMRRSAALQKAKENLMKTKEAFWQGGGGVNEPTPGKPKYPKDPLNEKDREKEDKQMVGQKPFPGVGDVDGLHPSPASVDEKDELERKKMLQRASLKARFVRVANTDGTENPGQSAWQIFAKDESGEKLLLSASVDEITGNRSDVLFDVVATKDFAGKMLEKIRSEGVAKATAFYKKSQAVAGPGASPAAGPDAGGPGPVPAMPGDPGSAPDADATKDMGGDGDTKETANKLAEEIRDKASDLLEAVKDLSGEQSEMSDVESGVGALPKAASETLLPLFAMRKQFNTALSESMKKSLAALKEHHDELKLLASLVDEGTSENKEYATSITEESFTDAKSALKDVDGIMEAYAKYLTGSEGLYKQAMEAEEHALAADDNEVDDLNLGNDMVGNKDMCADDQNAHYDLDLDMDLPKDDTKDTDKDDVFDLDKAEPKDTEDENAVMMDVDPNTLAGKKVEIKAEKKFDLTTKEGRSAYRATLSSVAMSEPTGKQDDGEVEDASKIKFNDVLNDAHKHVDHHTKLDVKPSDNLDLIETIEEKNKAMLDVAKAPPKVRKEAEKLNQFIVEGKVSENDLDSLVAQGLDSEVVKYWRQFWGQAGKEGSEFSKLLTTETMKAKAEEDTKVYRIKLARAYELANDMVSRDLLANDRGAVNAQVDEIMKWNDEGFESMKRVIAKHTPKSLKKNAMPIVGLVDPLDREPQSDELDLKSELDRAFSNRKY